MLTSLGPVTQSLLASLFTWALTALGAAVVFVSPSSNRGFLDASLGFSSGVMLAASFWSLLSPAVEISEGQMAQFAFVPVAIGFALGALFVHCADTLTQSYHGCTHSDQILLLHDESSSANQQKDIGFHAGAASSNFGTDQQNSSLRHRFVESPPPLETMGGQGRTIGGTGASPQQNERHSQRKRQSWHRICMLIIAITAHNFPEGLAVGVGFGGAGTSASVSLDKASNLALSIGLQNFPEGMAVALPLAAFGMPKWKAFLWGQLSGMVEPMAALIGASLVLSIGTLLPYALSFAAGAMIFVVFDSIIPETNSHGNGKVCSLFAMLGFLVMMSLEIGADQQAPQNDQSAD